jgi:16S rRNA (adenine1518-N6/adenine1519-N6)-dimethyltransferase
MMDSKALAKVIECAQLSDGDVILEVGAGTGALTRELAKVCSVTAIEKDKTLADSLEQEFKGDHSVRILMGDALKIEWPKFNKCVSNLPYSISKKFVLKLLMQEFNLAVLVLQKEFAEKLIVKPGNKNYGVVSVCAQLCAGIEVLDHIPRNVFKPQPKVESALVRLRSEKRLDNGFLEFVTKLFQHRNKVMRGTKRVNQLTPKEFFTLYGDNI